MCLVTGLPPLANSLPISSIPNLHFADGHLSSIFVEQAMTDHSWTMLDALPVRYQDDHWTSKGIEAGPVASIFGLRWGVASWLNGLLSHVDPVLQHFVKKCSRTGLRCQWWLRFNSCDKPRAFHKMCLACTVDPELWSCAWIEICLFLQRWTGRIINLPGSLACASSTDLSWNDVVSARHDAESFQTVLFNLLSEATAIGVVFIMFSRDVQSRLVGTSPTVSQSQIVKSLDSSSATSWMNLRENLGSNEFDTDCVCAPCHKKSRAEVPIVCCFTSPRSTVRKYG